MPTVFVANKSDRSDEMKFGPKDIEEVASGYGSPCFLTSAKTGENIDEVFGSLGQKIMSNSMFDRKPIISNRTGDPWTYIPVDYDFQLPR